MIVINLIFNTKNIYAFKVYCILKKSIFIPLKIKNVEKVEYLIQYCNKYFIA